jgi:hypothetical protein
MGYVALGLGGVFLVVLLLRGFLNASPAQLASILRWTMAVAGVVLFAYLAATERLAALLAFLGAVLTFLFRAGGAWRMWQRAQSMFGGVGGSSPWGPQPGRSEVETEFVRMTLDHGSGVMEGTVRRGRFGGRRLAELSREELIELVREARAEDESSAALIEAYLDRRHAGWRDAAQPGTAPGAAAAGPMTRDEAWKILGLRPDASPADVKAAHHRLMQRVHPDTGGSDWLAARINLARDILLKS